MAQAQNAQCPCCGTYSLHERGAGEVCPDCRWKDESADDRYEQPPLSGSSAATSSATAAFDETAPLPRAAQFSGSLLGQCLGDALGFPVEGYSSEACARYAAAMAQVEHAGSRGRGHFPFGQYTDDSQLARELLQSIVRCRRFDPVDYARRIAALFTEERLVGGGQATTAAARRLTYGISWERSGTTAPAAGNGSAMRAGPIGLLHFSDPAALIRAARDQGHITHQDPRCAAGAIAVAGAVALALRPGPVDVAAFTRRLAAWAGEADSSVAAAIARLPAWVRLSPEEAVVPIAALSPRLGRDEGWEGISPFVTSTVAWSLYAYLRSPDDYWTTIRTAIAVGGDVDTTAAIAGAISGARVGLEGLPAGLLLRLEDQGTWKYEALVALAEACHALATANHS